MTSVWSKITEYYRQTKRRLGEKNPQEAAQSSSKAEEEIDSPALDLTRYLEDDIGKVKKMANIKMKEKEVQKFIENAKIHLVCVKNMSPPKPKRLLSKKKSVFKNRTKTEVSYAFRMGAQDTTTASLTTRKGFRVGILGVLGGVGMGAQGAAGVGASYSKQTEVTKEQSKSDTRELQATVQVPSEKSLIATELMYSSDYDATCEFDITVDGSYKIKYLHDGKKDTIKAQELVELNDIGEEKSALEGGSKSKEKTKLKDLVHLRRTWNCTIESTEQALDIEMGEVHDSDTEQ